MISASRQSLTARIAVHYRGRGRRTTLAEEATNENLMVPNGTSVVVPKDHCGVAGAKGQKFITHNRLSAVADFQANRWAIRQAHIRQVRASASSGAAIRRCGSPNNQRGAICTPIFASYWLLLSSSERHHRLSPTSSPIGTRKPSPSSLR